MRLKKRFIACCLLAMLLSLITQTTLAYFTAQETARNVITSGGIDIKLNETTSDGSEFTDVTNVMPGDEVSKIVSVSNLQMPAYIRIGCDIQILDADDQPMDLTDAQLAAILSLDYAEDHWTYVNGWWYYDAPVATGATTVPLFTEVTFNTLLENEYQDCTVLITVQAQATQVANNGTGPVSASWPEAE